MSRGFDRGTECSSGGRCGVIGTLVGLVNRGGVRQIVNWPRRLLCVVAALIASGAFAAAGALAQVPPVGASAEIRDVSGRLVANAEFREGRGEVLITIIFASPPPLTGTHGLRIHEVGRCDPPSYQTAGNGFNPLNQKHGRQNPEGPQVGDLPNVNFTTGLTSYNTSAVGATLGQGPTSLLGPNRTAIVVYEREDDQLTDPDGKAGARIACGVINPVSAIAASPIAAQQPGQPAAPKPATSPITGQQPVQPGQPVGQPGQPAVQPAPAKPTSSPIIVPPPVVVKPAASPTVAVASAASPVAPVQVAVPTVAAPAAASQTSQSGGSLGTLPALIIAVVGVGLVGAGYLLRRRSQLQRQR